MLPCIVEFQVFFMCNHLFSAAFATPYWMKTANYLMYTIELSTTQLP